MYENQSNIRQLIIPKTTVKFIVALFLFPLALILSITLCQIISFQALHSSFRFLLIGCLLFFLLFLIVPRYILMVVYIYGHEITHALWVKLFGGQVKNRFYVSATGGHILTNKINTWIALAPYFFPFYTFIVITIYLTLIGAIPILGYFGDIFNIHSMELSQLSSTLISLKKFFYYAIGSTLCFHFCFTFLLIIQGQSDLQYGGYFFSVMLIYCINILIITCLFLATTHLITAKEYCHLFILNTFQGIELIKRSGNLLYNYLLLLINS